MGAFPRDIVPYSVTPPSMPGPLVSISQSGKINTRSHARIGRTWQESYRFKYDSTGRGFVAELMNLYRNGTNFTIQHQLYKTTLGAGGGTPLVNGSTQTGQSIVTDGWPNLSTGATVATKGDLVTFNGVNTVFDITAASTSSTSGDATLSINPPIYAGGSPANNAAITITTGVNFTAKLLNPPDLPPLGPHTFWVGFTLTFTEDV